MTELQEIINPIIGSVLAGNVTAKRLTLTIEANSPGWAMQVKLLQSELLKTLNAALPLPIDDIVVNVRRTGK